MNPQINQETSVPAEHTYDVKGYLLSEGSAVRQLQVGLAGGIVANLEKELQLYGAPFHGSIKYECLKGKNKMTRAPTTKTFDEMGEAYRFAGDRNHVFCQMTVPLYVNSEPLGSVVLNSSGLMQFTVTKNIVCEADLDKIWKEITDDDVVNGIVASFIKND